MLIVCQRDDMDFKGLTDGFTFQECNVTHYQPQDFSGPFDVVLFIGVSCVSYMREFPGRIRLIEIPGLENIRWTPRRLAFVGRIIREGTEDLEIRLDKRTGQVIAESLVPF